MTCEYEYEAIEIPCLQQEIINVFVAGDEHSGKCSLIKVFTNSEIEKTNNELKCVVECLYTLESSTAFLRIWYVQNLYGAMEDLKEICNHQKSVILFCYSRNCIDTLVNLLVQWIPEIKEQIGTSVPGLLVETENNLTISESRCQFFGIKHFSSLEDEPSVMLRLHLNGFLRCSINDVTSVEKVFRAAVTFAS
ncbi:Rho-related protein racL like protein [Argiope bruennichi]|uniref:Rho-related protein racL like protein n=1 Tax=Argiope bruennichi TaxID=94029 RepID=A0A8T0ETJ8_ARGBR|nr:Rho-related protein racL like protein [Argiope bruennichi]